MEGSGSCHLNTIINLGITNRYYTPPDIMQYEVHSATSDMPASRPPQKRTKKEPEFS